MSLIHLSQIKSLTPDEQNAIKASNGKLVKTLEPVELYDSILLIVTESIALKGQGKNITQDDIAFITANFSAELKRCFTTFTVEQVREAARLGALGKLNTDTGHVS